MLRIVVRNVLPTPPPYSAGGQSAEVQTSVPHFEEAQRGQRPPRRRRQNWASDGRPRGSAGKPEQQAHRAHRERLRSPRRVRPQDTCTSSIPAALGAPQAARPPAPCSSLAPCPRRPSLRCRLSTAAASARVEPEGSRQLGSGKAAPPSPSQPPPGRAAVSGAAACTGAQGRPLGTGQGQGSPEGRSRSWTVSLLS